MRVEELIVSIIIFINALILIILSILHFAEKGFLLNNAYIYASKNEREKMNKKPYYRQSAISFCILSVIFIVSGLTVIFSNTYILFAEIPLIVGLIIYVILSSIKINKSNNYR
ncbi:MAG: DUF3784 domain-containing protein [Clostridia bacterium]|nr:DUF3784 domain-containing protein [Clostridia bacterium]